VVSLLIVLFYVLFVCTCVLPTADNPNAVNKYIMLSILCTLWNITQIWLRFRSQTGQLPNETCCRVH